MNCGSGPERRWRDAWQPGNALDRLPSDEFSFTRKSRRFHRGRYSDRSSASRIESARQCSIWGVGAPLFPYRSESLRFHPAFTENSQTIDTLLRRNVARVDLSIAEIAV